MFTLLFNYLYLASYAQASNIMVTTSNSNGRHTVRLKIHQYRPQSQDSVRKYARRIVPRAWAIIEYTVVKLLNMVSPEPKVVSSITMKAMLKERATISSVSFDAY